MIDIILKNKNSSAKLTLPASRWDVLDAQARLGAGNLNDSIVRFEGPDSLPQLGRLLDTMRRDSRFFDELNYFARRVADMNHSERTRLGGAIVIHGAEDMKALINLTGHLDNIVTADVDTDYALGRFLVEHDFVDFPENVIPYLDFAKIGAEHHANNTCAFVEGLYFEDLSPEIKEIYDGHSLPDAPNDTHIFNVTISGYFPEYSIDLLLPATESEVSAAMLKLNTSYQSDIYITNAVSRIALLGQAVRPNGQTAEDLSFGVLNELAHTISAMDDAGYVKFLAVLEHNRVFTTEDTLVTYPAIDEVLECAVYADNYSLDPGIRPQDVGSYGFVTAAEEQKLEPERTAAPQSADFEMDMGMMT